MAIPGQRFEVNLSDGDSSLDQGESDSNGAGAPSFAFIGDIKERGPALTPKPPAAPTSRSSVTGFPAHKKRSHVSAFRRQRTNEGASETPAAQPSSQLPQTTAAAVAKFEQDDRRRIDQENKQRLAAMTPQEVEKERAELLASLDPSLVSMFLKRANLDDGRGDTGTEPIPKRPARSVQPRNTQNNPPLEPPPTSREDAHQIIESSELSTPLSTADLPPKSLPPDLLPARTKTTPKLGMHFPKPPKPPDLDPSSSTFLDDLHTKYFPDLEADPTRLAWMKPLAEDPKDSAYSSSQNSVLPAAIRFSFRGTLLSPKAAAKIPVTKGLHHHGQAPEAAGYTIPELAHLARSAFPAQRCIAYQTLGRILYRLGLGEFGPEGTELRDGLWGCMQQGRVLDSLMAEAGSEGGHTSAKAHATEALWLWRRGGGDVKKAV
ncbi:MAG: hypothetical protein M1824_002606 [Vezdaea acicularis]|nr:MAG: hypothetical protein M1824_002606 [Vezdaea acicularis]